jgi:hypothetical protein
MRTKVLAAVLVTTACGGKLFSNDAAGGSGTVAAGGGGAAASATAGSSAAATGGAGIGGATDVSGAGGRQPDIKLCEGPLEKGVMYQMSCRWKKLPAPFAYLATVRATPVDATKASLDMTTTPLSAGARDPSDVGGPSVVWPTSVLGADCTFTERIDTLTLPAKANTIGGDFVMEKVVLRGRFFSFATGCAELDGSVPRIMLSLENDGDVCLFARTSPDSFLLEFQSKDYVCDPSVLPPR